MGWFSSSVILSHWTEAALTTLNLLFWLGTLKNAATSALFAEVCAHLGDECSGWRGSLISLVPRSKGWSEAALTVFCHRHLTVLLCCPPRLLLLEAFPSTVSLAAQKVKWCMVSASPFPSSPGEQIWVDGYRTESAVLKSNLWFLPVWHSETCQAASPSEKPRLNFFRSYF